MKKGLVERIKESLIKSEIPSGFTQTIYYCFLFSGVPVGYAPWRILNFNKKSEFPYVNTV